MGIMGYIVGFDIIQFKEKAKGTKNNSRGADSLVG